MKKYFLLSIFSLILFIFLQLSCHSPTAPKQNNSPDTTSSNFTFQTYTFGESNAGSSYLNDVAIVNDSDIWAVGAVYLTDSTGKPDPFPYNAIHWNGNNWKEIKIPYNYQGQVFYHPIESTFAFGTNNIWFAGNGVIQWDGSQYNPVALPSNIWGQEQINKMWGVNDNFYIVGSAGSIANYQNGTWQKIESGTTTNIADIWGANGTILCTVSNKATPGDIKILRILSNNSVDSISWNRGREVRSLWFSDTSKIFACGDGVFIRGSQSSWTEQKTLPSYYATKIRGIASNDVIVCGDFGLLAHYNGVSWTSYNIPNTLSLVLSSLDFKGNTVVVTGYDGSKAYIIMGKR
jgi:hypothetical protein